MVNWASGQIDYQYDQTGNQRLGVGRLTTITETGTHLAALSSGIETRYYYDLRGNVVRQEGNVGGYAYSVGYRWDLADHLTGITYPDGREISYGRNGVGQIGSVQSSDGIPAVTLAGTISHAPFGGPSGWQFWNQQTVSVGRDTKYRITTLQSSKASPVVVAQDLTLTYNTANLVTVITDNTAALSESFGYDKLYRLVNSTGSYGALVWKYDATGNRTKQTLNTTVSNLAYPATNNRLTSVGSLTRQYDAAGNLTQELRSDGSTRSYAYNALGRLSAVTRTVGGSGAMPVASYYHNALGQRVAKYVAASGQWTYYVYDLDGKLLLEQPGNSTAHRDYVYLDALPLALIDVPVNPATQATKAYAIHTDHLGTPMRLTDTTGTVVWALDSTPFDAIHGAFGLPNEDVDLNGISITYNARFPGQYFDAETGLNYNYFRDYDPGTGRYIESDPIGLEGGLNTYAYAGSNPLVYIDPDGLLFGIPAGESYGDSAAEYWANRAEETGNWAYHIPGAVAALWTPCTSDKTFLTLAGGYAARIFGPFTTRGAPRFIARYRKYIRYDRSHHGKPPGWDGEIPKWWRNRAPSVDPKPVTPPPVDSPESSDCGCSN
ncbi:MAG: RHS repeat-associated core domain-containing protein [Gammaproteobacteria bacterium]|nr:RHS repeat-associated core domain-containing protein [Gammaproteobacteria bacterium]